MRVHVIPTGRLNGNKTFMRGEGWGSLFRPQERYEFPAYVYVLEHPDGLIAVDTGMTSRARTPRPARRFVPVPTAGPEDEIGPRMRAAGLNPGDVRLVLVTHLDWDHAGGVAHFPHAEIRVHRPEYEFSKTVMGKIRYQPKLWPDWFSPALFDLEDEPFGPFPQSLSVTDAGDVRLVPIPGHSIGQVGVVVRVGRKHLFFGADHMLRQDWFLADYAAGRHVQLGVFFREESIASTRRIHEFLERYDTVLLPAHDADAVRRLAEMKPVRV